MTQARFAIVVPTFQADGWLDQALNSIFSQAGGHVVRVHLQDGGSTDATLEIAERWRALTENPASPFSRRLTMSIDSAPDGGLYDAVARGFEVLAPEPDELMTWLNADDLLAPGALASVASCLEELPDISLCGGRVSMIDADGRVVRVNAPVALSQKLVAAGCHDGRRMPFVMQEGTFWRQDLWAKVGGLDPSFRLAGDWDLWRRMARHAEFVTLDVLTAFHRRRPGQLSENLDVYYAEIDRRLTGSARELYDHAYRSYIASGSRAGGQAFEGFEGAVAQLDRDSLIWSMTHRFGERLAPPVVQTVSEREAMLRGGVLSGAKGFEGPYPEWDLPGGVRWITERHARLSVPTAQAGRHAVRLLCRPGVADLSITIRSGDEVVLHAVVDPRTPAGDHALVFDLWSGGGETALDIETATPHGEPENRLLVVDLTSTPLACAEVRAPLAEADHVVIAADRRPQGLAASLAALADQPRVPAATVIVTARDAATDAILDAWRPMVRELIDCADADEIARRLSGGFDLLMEAGVRPAPEALPELLRRRGAARETDGRARTWLRPAASITERLVAPGSVSSSGATDRPLTLGSPSDAIAPRPRLLRLIAADGDRRDALGRLFARMDAEVRLLTLPPTGAEALLEAELKAWRPRIVSGVPAALARLPSGFSGATLEETANLFRLAETAIDRLAFSPRPRAAARALFGLDVLTEVWAVEAADLDQARAQAEADTALLVIGDRPVRGDERIFPAGPAEDAEVLSWVLSAADRLWAGPGASPRLRMAACACEIPETGPAAKDGPASLDEMAAALLGAASAEAVDPLHAALRFRAAEPNIFSLGAGPGARAGPDGVAVETAGVVFLSGPASTPVRLKLTASDDASREVRVSSPDSDQTLELKGGRAMFAVTARAGGLVPVRLSMAGGAAHVALMDGQSGGLSEAAPWEAQQGFGREEPPAPDLGLATAFRWIEAKRARLAVLNDRAGWRRLTLRLRTLSPDQRVLVRAGGRTVLEAGVEGGDLRRPVAVEAVVNLAEGWSEIDLRFFSAVVMPTRSLAAIIDGVEIGEADPADAMGPGWRDLDGFDFEEPPVPQYGLETAFRWRLPGARIAVRGETPGRHHVVVRYRTALPGQTLTASAQGRDLARNKAETGRLDIDERLAFDIDLGAEPLEIALDADRYMEGDRPLGFIIQSVSVEPTL